MKYRSKRCIIAALISMVTLIGAGGCGAAPEETKVVIEPMEAETVYAYSPDFIGGTDVMPISGFYGPYNLGHSYMGESVPDYVSDEIFALLNECGINMIKSSILDSKAEPEGQIEMLELAEKYGMAVFIRHTDIEGRHLGEEFTAEEMAEAINKFANYTAFAGIDLVDEPGTDYWWSSLSQGHIVDYEQRADLLNELGVAFGVNSIGVSKSIGDIADRYLTDFCTIFNPKYLCHTNYRCAGNTEVVSDSDLSKGREEQLWGMDKVRTYANKYNLPMWRYIQAGGQWNDSGSAVDSEPYYPSEGQLHWAINTTLAYGAKGISYFPLIQPLQFSYAKTEPYDSQRNGLIGAWGNKTQWWYYAKKANEQIAAVDHVLMNSVNKGILVSGESAVKETRGQDAVMKGTSWRELKDIAGSAMVGCFNYQGKTAFYVVNYEDEYKQLIDLEFFNTYKLTVIQRTETSYIETNNLTLDMNPGEGVLIVVDN